MRREPRELRRKLSEAQTEQDVVAAQSFGTEDCRRHLLIAASVPATAAPANQEHGGEGGPPCQQQKRKG
eukprot:6084078-Pleurochrysis_carterae.AAC.2